MSDFKTKAKAFLGSENTASGALTAIIIATVLAVNVVIFVIASTFGLSFTTAEKDQIVLTGATDTLFEDVIADRKTVKISFCYPTRDEVANHVTGAFVHKTAEEFAKRYDFIEIEYINLITKKNHKGENVDIKKYQTDMQGNPTLLSRASIIFECGKNYKVVTDTYSSSGFADFYILDASGNATAYAGEAYMASMIKWVTTDEHPTAYLTVGHSEQVDSTFGRLLVSGGYLIDTIDLKKEEVPEDAGLLIISNPISDFERAAAGSGVRTEIERLNTYIENGGNIYVSLDPYVKNLPVFEEFLRGLGIGFSETEVNGKRIRNIVKDSSNAITTDGFTLVTDFADNDVANKIEETVRSYSDGGVIVREAAALELSKTAKPLLISTPSSSTEAGGKQTDSAGSYPIAAYAEIDGRGKNVASVFVVSSVYMTVSDALITNGYSNTDFIYSVFDNLFAKQGMPYGCAVVRSDSGLLENLTMGTARIYTALILAVPAILAAAGVVVVVKRRNR